MPITDLLERNSKLYGEEIALVEINPEVQERQRVTWKEYELIQPTSTAPYRRDQMDENFMRIKRVYLASHDVRRFGCSALELCYLACGRADGMFEYGVKPWDIAAGILILHEAGGEAKCVDGGKLPLDRETEIVATNGNFTEELRAIL